MTCSEAKLKLEPCVSGTLSPEDRIALEEHLAICEGCRLELELTRAVMGAASPNDPPSEPRASEPRATEPRATEPPAVELETPPPPPPMSEARKETALFDEISFDNLESTQPTAEPAPAAPSGAPSAPPGAGEPDPFANFTKKPEPSESAAASWDFEPVEVPRDASPPEGSLSFAQEALTRKRAGEVKRKAALVRLALWGGGIGCGLVLLGVSVWIALAFRQDRPEPPNDATHSTPPPTDTATPTPVQPAPAQNPPDGSAAPVPAPDASQPPPTASTPTETAPGPTPPTLLDTTPGVVPSPGPPPPDTKVAADGSSKTGTSATKPKPKPVSKSAVKPAAGSTTAKSGSAEDEGLFPWTPVDDPPVARTVRRSQPPSQPQPAPVNPPAPSPAPTLLDATPGVAPANPPSQTSAQQTAPAPPVTEAAPTKPIDRLHLATETAAKNADLATLRKLKSSWKSLIGSTAGPDRARAKREYADCLWAIQEITGRNSDRRDALAAYRDFVLYAPAGGTDARTVSRMRFLEDILGD
jgi:putative zinc finger protein